MDKAKFGTNINKNFSLIGNWCPLLWTKQQDEIFQISSLCPEKFDDPSWLKVYKDSDDPDRISHEKLFTYGENEDKWDYD